MISYKNTKGSFIFCSTSDSLEGMHFSNFRIYFFQVSLQLVSLCLSIICILNRQYIPKYCCVNFSAICNKFSREDNDVDLKIMLKKQKNPSLVSKLPNGQSHNPSPHTWRKQWIVIFPCSLSPWWCTCLPARPQAGASLSDLRHSFATAPPAPFLNLLGSPCFLLVEFDARVSCHK